MHNLNKKYLLAGVTIMLFIMGIYLLIPLLAGTISIAEETLDLGDRIVTEAELKQEIVQLTRHVQEREERLSGALISLPARGEISSLYEQLVKYAGRFNVSLTEINPSNIEDEQNLSALPIELVTESSTHELMLFINALENQSDLFLIRQLNTASIPKRPGTVVTRLNLEAFLKG